MDEHNLHHFWGYSGSLDLLSVMPIRAIGTDADGPCNLLQVSPCDPRHTLTTLCRASRHECNTPVHIYVYEDNAEAMARHVLLLAILLDHPVDQALRMQRFMEVFGNSLIRDDTLNYLKQLCRRLEALLVDKVAQRSISDDTVLGHLLDISMLRYEAKDALISAIERTRSPTPLDMNFAWDLRCRKWYGDRYDFRRNMIDWDYHMRLMDGTSDPPPQSIIHFAHFRHWRLTGLAFEVRDSQYTVPNQSLFSTAAGRTKEFKDRNCNDVGRSVTAHGLWSDILCSPYHSFGTSCEDDSYFQVSNKAYKHTAVDVSERNILALLHELYTGRVPEEAELRGGCVHRARPARGPTTAKDLQEAMGDKRADGAQAVGARDDVTAPEAPRGCDEACRDAADQTDGLEGQLEQECRVAEAAGEGGQHSGAAAGSTEHLLEQPCAKPAAQPLLAHAQEDDGTVAAHDQPQGADNSRETELSAAMEAAANSRLQRFKIFLVTGDFVKQLSGRRALAGAYSGATVGVMSSHLLQKQNRLAETLAPGARVLVESAKNVIQIPKAKLPALNDKIVEWAKEGGLQMETANDKHTSLQGLAEHKVFVKPAEPVGG
eukprot:jgi/Ulvmu1/955/UM102_0038.1